MRVHLEIKGNFSRTVLEDVGAITENLVGQSKGEKKKLLFVRVDKAVLEWFSEEIISFEVIP